MERYREYNEGKKEAYGLDTERYKLPAAQQHTTEAWQTAVNNAKVQIENKNASIADLELLQEHGPNAWRLHNYQLETAIGTLEQEKETVTREKTLINRERKAQQVFFLLNIAVRGRENSG